MLPVEAAEILKSTLGHAKLEPRVAATGATIGILGVVGLAGLGRGWRGRRDRHDSVERPVTDHRLLHSSKYQIGAPAHYERRRPKIRCHSGRRTCSSLTLRRAPEKGK
jgi:hypothetical protein